MPCGFWVCQTDILTQVRDERAILGSGEKCALRADFVPILFYT